jgi:hypothetical protein
MFHYHKKCRACGSDDLTPVIDLGTQPLANDFQKEGSECAGFAPLKVLFCKNCTLAQLSVVVKPEILYSNYSYVTSASKTMREHFEALWKDIKGEMGGPIGGAKLLEVGSNNGEFLIGATRIGFDCLGIEPAKNLADASQKRGVRTINRFFDMPNAIQLDYTGYKADVIVARHVFGHVDDWNGFILACEKISHQYTLLVMEVPWVVDMFRMNSWDQVYHEHLSYVSISAICKMLEKTSFYIQDVKHYPIHGGAIALMIRRKIDGGASTLFSHWQSKFQEKDLETQWLSLKVNRSLMAGNLKTLLYQVAAKKVCGFGASAKSTVWINSMGLTRKDIAFVCDSTPQKQGKLVPGTDIQIMPESELEKADVAINFAWNFPEIYDRFKNVQWISPCPDPKLL